MSEVIDGWNPDLSGFAARGGRLIHYHGWSDPGVPPLNSIAYYDRVVDRVASTQHISREQAALAKVQNYRLFMAPGMQHCTGGPGPDRFDGLTPLRNWVEKKQAPDQIRARRHVNRTARSTSAGRSAPTRWSRAGPARAAPLRPPISSAGRRPSRPRRRTPNQLVAPLHPAEALAPDKKRTYMVELFRRQLRP